jgi:hypothetical protein
MPTPVFEIDAVGETMGFYRLFAMEFDRLWSRSRDAPMTLDDESARRARR